MHEAKTKLSALVAAVERGEEVVIARNGAPAARLVAIRREYPRSAWGSWPGRSS